MTQTPVDVNLSGRRLVICSNREPYTVTPTEDGYEYDATVGGLVSAMIPIMRATEGLWVSWAGGDPEVTEKLPVRQEIPDSSPRFTQRRVFLTGDEVENYYYGFSNQALWPLCHYFLERSNFNKEHWNAYKNVNRKFADALTEEKDTENDLIWIQDYHMALVGGMLKDASSDISSGIFWHIPFPHADFFRFIPWRVELLEGLLGNDVIGFHTRQYCVNFGTAVESILGYEFDQDTLEIQTDSRVVKLLPRAIGVNFDYFNGIGDRSETSEQARDIKQDLNASRLILGVDRLDYTKGIKQRLLTLERFLKEYPEYHGDITFLQIAVPSRQNVPEYQEMKEEIDYHVGRINGEFSSDGWIPVHYFFHGLPQEELIAYYKAADVALVTPIRDGMNLIAKEFAASRSDKKGTLILGELAGAAIEFPDLVHINPFDIESGAGAIKAALEMPAEQERRTMKQMREQVREKDLKWWIEENLHHLQQLE